MGLRLGCDFRGRMVRFAYLGRDWDGVWLLWSYVAGGAMKGLLDLGHDETTGRVSTGWISDLQ